MTRAAVAERVHQRHLNAASHLFPGRCREAGHLSTRQYARIVSGWVTAVGLDRHAYGNAQRASHKGFMLCTVALGATIAPDLRADRQWWAS